MYSIIILPLVLYACATSFFNVQEECRLRVFVKGMLMGVFESTRYRSNSRWRKFQNKELNNLYSSP
jgi:hypothetical protein